MDTEIGWYSEGSNIRRIGRCKIRQFVHMQVNEVKSDEIHQVENMKKLRALLINFV